MDLEGLNRRIISCRKCPRLVEWRETVARDKRRAYSDWEYWGKPVPGFGDMRARILVVGLAPGAHGSNRTGRQFTGDASGRFLYPALFRAGLATQPESTARDDGLRLQGLYLSASCRCVPPANRPTPDELDNCRPYLAREIELLAPRVIVCLGIVAFKNILRIHGLRASEFAFRHAANHQVPAGQGRAHRWLLCSYHPSQQNTLTGRLTPGMFDRIWASARELAGRGGT
ncbi:MAG: uracil-DNA glycosylase [Chloroflexota bacterium]